MSQTSSNDTTPAPGRLGRILNRGALAFALMGVMNAAVVFWFLDSTEADGTTILLISRQKAIALELLELAAVRAPTGEPVESAQRAAIRDFDASIELLRHGGRDGSVEVPPAPRVVSDAIGRIEGHWAALKGALADKGERQRVRALTERLAREADVVLATLRERRRVYRNALAALAGVASLFFVAVSVMGARFFKARVIEPARRLSALARRAVERRPPPTMNLPPDHELGRAAAAVTDLSTRLEEVRSERDDVQADYQAVLDNSLAGIYRVEADGRVSLANEALAELLGYASASELVEAVRDADRELFVDADRSGPASSHPILETKMRRKDGSEVWVLESARHTSQNGETAREGVVFDITPRKNAFDALRRLTGRLMEIQDEERQRLARELHDSMGQLLAAMKMNLTRLEDTVELTSEASELLRDSLELGDEASRQTRTMSHLLHPPLLDELGLEHAVRDLAAGYQKRSGITVEVDVSVPERLPGPVETCLFRFVQECLTNVHRHSESDRATIRLFRRDGELFAQCQDWGRGMPENVWRDDGEMESLGVGLRGLHARLDQLGGRLEIESSGSGTLVTAIMRLATENTPRPR